MDGLVFGIRVWLLTTELVLRIKVRLALGWGTVDRAWVRRCNFREGAKISPRGRGGVNALHSQEGRMQISRRSGFMLWCPAPDVPAYILTRYYVAKTEARRGPRRSDSAVRSYTSAVFNAYKPPSDHPVLFSSPRQIQYRLDRAWKPGFSPGISVFSALDTFVIIVLYKSTLTILYHTLASELLCGIDRKSGFYEY